MLLMNRLAFICFSASNFRKLVPWNFSTLYPPLYAYSSAAVGTSFGSITMFSLFRSFGDSKMYSIIATLTAY